MSTLSQFLGAGPVGDAPIANGLISTTSSNAYAAQLGAIGLAAASTTSTSLIDVVNYTGAGVLEFCGEQVQAAAAYGARLVITIDGMVVFDSSTGAAQWHAVCPVGLYTTANAASLGAVPFKSSLRIQHSVANATQTARCTYKYRKTR